MKQESFVHLNIQTDTTPGAIDTASRYGLAARGMGLTAIGVADQEIRTWPVWERECAAWGLVPLFGWETTFNLPLDKRPRRLTYMVESPRGFHTIQSLTMLQRDKGQLDSTDLAAYTDGVIVLATPFSYPDVVDMFPSRQLFLEVVSQGSTVSRSSIKHSLQLAATYNATLVASNRVWHAAPRLFDVTLSHVLQMKSRKQMYGMEHRDPTLVDTLKSNIRAYAYFEQYRRYKDAVFARHPEGWLKSSAMMQRALAELPQAFSATSDIAKRVTHAIPAIDIPPFPVSEGDTPFQLLSRLTHEGARQRYAERYVHVQARIENELQLVGEKHLESIFLLAKMIGDTCDQLGCSHVPEGSSTGSVIGYSLGITDIDPVEHNLSFERFLNVATKKIADIDIAVNINRRDEIVDAVSRRFAQLGMATSRIATIPTYSVDGAIRAVMRTFGFSASEVKQVQSYLDSKTTLPREYVLFGHLANQLGLRKIATGDVSTHGTKVVVYDPAQDILAHRADSKGHDVVEVDKVTGEQLANFDLLGRTGPALIDGILRRLGGQVDIPLHDPYTLSMIFKGEVIGIPYIETRWLQSVISCFRAAIPLDQLTENDLSIAFALSRPAAQPDMFVYLRRRAGYEQVTYAHPQLETILGETFGTVIYQDQTMRLAQHIGDFSPKECEDLRKAISKQRRRLKIGQYEDKFIRGATTKGISESEAKALFASIKRFVEYGFVKGHVLSLMQQIAYRIAYLKYHYPQEFFTELFELGRNHFFTINKRSIYVREAAKYGISIK